MKKIKDLTVDEAARLFSAAILGWAFGGYVMPAITRFIFG